MSQAKPNLSLDLRGEHCPYNAIATLETTGCADVVAHAKKTGTTAEHVPSNHAPTFIPEMQPTLDTAVTAMTAAALTWLAADSK